MYGLNDLPNVLFAAAVVSTLVAGTAVLARRSASSRQRGEMVGVSLLDGGLAGALTIALLATLMPVGMLGRAELGRNINLVPLVELAWSGPELVAINLLLLVPFGLVAALRFPRLGPARLTLAGLGVSVLIELLQLTHPLRGTNVDDVLLNTFGAGCGAAVGLLITRAGAGRRARKAHRSTVAGRRE